MEAESKPIPTIEEVLTRMDEEWTPDRYCRNTLARNADGDVVAPEDESAEKFCALGFIRYLTFDHRGFEGKRSKLHSNEWELPAEPAWNGPRHDEYVAVRRIYYAASARLEENIACGSIPASNDNPNGYKNIKKAIAAARRALEEQKAQQTLAS